MKIIADLHIHSKYSRAVSPEMTLPKIAEWGKKKGIGLLATGDWTHPLWFREIKANLEEVAEGLYRLKTSDGGLRSSEKQVPEDVRSTFQPAPNASFSSGQRDNIQSNSKSGIKGALEKGVSYLLKETGPLFILSTEISSIYSQNGKGHRIHNVVLAPSIDTVEKINKTLQGRGANLMSDGRPITGIPAPDLVKLILGIDEKCLIIPAHVWTPWFSLYGSESGFDSINECFGDMAKYIYAAETGLSSDPAMNWRIAELDNRSIISCSDAHSGPKLGREATVFAESENRMSNVKCQMSNVSYDDIRKAIKGESGKLKISYTLEFYPEEGKYHYTGHRNCGIKQSPEETKKLGEICPTCGRHLTIGVMHRVEQLATRQLRTENLKLETDENGVKWIGFNNRPPYAMLVPLQEILAEALGGLPSSQNIQNEYNNLVMSFAENGGIGGEFGVLLKESIGEITKIAGEKVAEGIKKVRMGDIFVDPGYDGVFGIVKIWSFDSAQDKGDKEEESKKQMSLF